MNCFNPNCQLQKNTHCTHKDALFMRCVVKEPQQIHQNSEADVRLNDLLSDIRFLMGFVPDWAKIVPKGLDATFYGTNTYEGDLEVKARVDKITKLIGT